MNNIFYYIKRWCDDLVSVIRREFTSIFTDRGVLLILFGAIFIYSTLYSLAYRNEVVRDMPIAVIDQSNSPASRQLVRDLSASPSVEVAYEPTSMESARRLFFEREIYGVVVIPSDFQRSIDSGEQAIFAVYADASYFLMYKNLFSAATSVMSNSSFKIEMETFMKAGMSELQAEAMAEPVVLKSTKLFNRVEGYAIFVMPVIMILILQQALLIAIGIIGGTFTERKLYTLYRDDKKRWFSPITVVLGKMICYLCVIIVLAVAVFGVYYKMWGYPSNSSLLDIIAFFVPYIISVTALSIALSTLFAKRESAILLLVVWSIPFMLLCAVSFPVEGMPAWLYNLGLLVPSSSAVQGFIRLEVMGATLHDVISQYRILWSLSAVYLLLALLMMHRRLKKVKNILEFNK